MIETNINSDGSHLSFIIRDLSEFFVKKEVTIFSGAGVSIPSGLPDSKKLIKSISSILSLSIEKLNIGTIKDRKLLDKVVFDYRLERILDSIVSYHGTAILKSILNFQSSKPTFNHKAAAILAKHGYLSHIITLNFDVLFEEAFQKNFVPFEWHLPLVSVPEHPKDKQPVVTITKPHGTFPFKGYSYREYFLAATLHMLAIILKTKIFLQLMKLSRSLPCSSSVVMPIMTGISSQFLPLCHGNEFIGFNIPMRPLIQY